MPQPRLSEQEFLSGLVQSNHRVVVVGPSRDFDLDPSLAHICSLVTHIRGNVTVVDPKLISSGVPSGDSARSFSKKKAKLLSEKSRGIIGGALEHLDTLQEFRKSNPRLPFKLPVIRLGTAISSGLRSESAHVWFLRGTQSWVQGEGQPAGNRYEQMIDEGQRVLKQGGKQVYFFEKSDPEQLAAFVNVAKRKDISYEIHKLKQVPYSLGIRTVRPHYCYYLALVLHK